MISDTPPLTGVILGIRIPRPLKKCLLNQEPIIRGSNKKQRFFRVLYMLLFVRRIPHNCSMAGPFLLQFFSIYVHVYQDLILKKHDEVGLRADRTAHSLDNASRDGTNSQRGVGSTQAAPKYPPENLQIYPNTHS